ncbi:hypothetical protein CANCADRAFT_104877 [Tortispora caseinolytica NRRL Y-17796]|uniref:Uncharacterized protein n=1 Tax=Tortispora caseinolytica NRRL Y-17796 TaxID=767744 RepID=A0A1E4TEW1_9ASCO|nr:hypothetical protein CANCADRAFT_104877 [Tortispora caseinolytica NRRL Y-17796]
MSSPQLPKESRRVKVYELVDSTWEDRGTGFCGGEMQHNDAFIFVVSETDPDQYFLRTQIFPTVEYQKQDDTLIVWTNPDDTDLALSFQESQGCDETHEFIQAAQRLYNDSPDDANPSDMMYLSTVSSMPEEPSPENLSKIEFCIDYAFRTQFGRDSLVQFLQKPGYLNKLLGLLAQAEEQSQANPDSVKDGNSMLFILNRILKAIFILNDSEIVEILISDENFTNVLGVLEYDSEYPNYKANHRSFIESSSKFKEVVPIPDDLIRESIVHTFRLQYLKDVALVRLVDDNTFTLLASLIYFSQVEIIQYIQNCESFIADLFGLYTKDSTPLETKRDGIRFLMQFVSTAKALLAEQRANIYAKFLDHGLYNAIIFALDDLDTVICSSGAELIMALIEDISFYMKDMSLKYNTSKNSFDARKLLKKMVSLVANNHTLSIKTQIPEAIRIFLTADLPFSDHGPDPERGAADTKKFYIEILQNLYDSILKINPEKAEHMSITEIAFTSYLCDLFCVCVRTEKSYILEFANESEIWTSLCVLLQSPNSQVVSSALRCFRHGIGSMHDLTINCIEETDFVKLALEITVSNLNRNTLLESAFLELFDSLQKVASNEPPSSPIARLFKTIATNHRELVNKLTVGSLNERYKTVEKIIGRDDTASNLKMLLVNMERESTTTGTEEFDLWSRSNDSYSGYFGTHETEHIEEQKCLNETKPEEMGQENDDNKKEIAEQENNSVTDSSETPVPSSYTEAPSNKLERKRSFEMAKEDDEDTETQRNKREKSEPTD